MRNRSLPLELVFWISALVLLATADPHAHHFSLCPLANIGIEWCPGCGLGRSISALFHGDVQESFTFHWFGIPALLVILYRTLSLGRRMISKQKGFNLKYKED
ncbi:MAG: DUF2752 domain-containing protein [Pedobacter sp.]|nr:MAG: DUF2752 domain-containing protein [Pedobacter sp.]